jgi:hypothetical protein
MTESGYGKYICTDLKEGVVMPGFKGPQTIRDTSMAIAGPWSM